MNRLWKLVACCACLCLATSPLSAGVVVLQNWTPAKIELTARGPDGKDVRYSLIPTDIAAIPTNGTVIVTLGEGADAHSYEAAVNSIHYLGMRDGKPELVHLALPGTNDKAKVPGQPAVQPAPAQPAQVAPGVYKIPVVLMVDTADPRTKAAWEKRLRKRLDDASDIFEHHCRVRFEVVAVGMWQSNPALHTFDEVLMDFAQKVRPNPARVAIGFTSRYDWLREESHLGGTHGALASHVLIRETLARISEPERLEVVVHELGHFLGAAHTSDQSSVMRPKLGDRRSTTKAFRIGFDAPNTLVMNLFAEEMRTRNIWHPSVLSPAAKDAVRGAYMALAQTIPKDPVSTSSIESLGSAPQAAAPPSIASPQLIFGARFVVQALAQAARENAKRPVSSKDPKAPLWRTGDDLMSYYIREGAAAAQHLPPQIASSAFLLGLGVALDESNYVHDKPALNEVWQKIEPEEQRQTRMLLMGSPTILKRHDVASQFTMSAALVVLSGPQGAEAAGLGKEILDSRSGNGFSFADLCANMSGVLFATHVREENIPLADIVKSFAIADYVPKMDGLPDDVSWDAFQKQYGEANSESFQRQRGEIFHRILALPPYRAPSNASKENTAAQGEAKQSTEK